MYRQMANDTSTYINNLNNQYLNIISNNLNLPLSEMALQTTISNYFPIVELPDYCFLKEHPNIPGFDILRYFSCSYFSNEILSIIDLILSDIVQTLYFMFVILIFLYLYTLICSIYGLRSILLNYREEENDEKDRVIANKED